MTLISSGEKPHSNPHATQLKPAMAGLGVVNLLQVGQIGGALIRGSWLGVCGDTGALRLALDRDHLVKQPRHLRQGVSLALGFFLSQRERHQTFVALKKS